MIVHVGTPKTGTTALQGFLSTHRSELKSRGILYPGTGLSLPGVPKHRWLAFALRDGDRASFDAHVAAVESECDERTRTVILSSEGVFNFWIDCAERAKRWFADLSDRYSVCFWLWLRDPADYCTSWYVQTARMPYDPHTPIWGHAKSPAAFLDDPWVAAHLDYRAIANDIESIFGPGSLYLFDYNGQTVAQACELLEISDLAVSEPRKNLSHMTFSAVELLHVTNAYSLAGNAKRIAIAAIDEIDATIGASAPAFALDYATRERARALCTMTRDDIAHAHEKSLERWKRLGAGPRTVYSFIVDRHPRFALQAHTFLETLLATGVAPQDVIAHVLPEVDAKTIASIERFGVRQSPLMPILDGAYCNKIAQLLALADLDVDHFILCDTDLAFLTDPAELADGSVRAKPVDVANPPLTLLDEIRAALGIAREPNLVPTSLREALTYSVNCNGGLYVIPGVLAAPIARQWFEETKRVLELRNLLGRYVIHADQIGFAMAMLRLGLEVHSIPIAWNFPYHLADSIPREVGDEPKILHYHDRSSHDGTLLASADASANLAAGVVNRILRAGRSKRRLILHVGASKTGSTALQRFLYAERATLRERDILYPSTGLEETPDRKHTWLVASLVNGDRSEFARRMALVESEAAQGATTIVLSTEGLFNHWWDFAPEARGWLAALVESYDVRCCLWLREPVAFFRSYYLQLLRNPRYEAGAAYGVDLTPAEMLAIPWVAKHLDYEAFRRELEATFGAAATYVFAYRSDIVEHACALLAYATRTRSERRDNVSELNAAGVALLGVLNRSALDALEKERGYALVAEIAAEIGSACGPFELNEPDRARVSALCTMSAEELRRLDADSNARWSP